MPHPRSIIEGEAGREERKGGRRVVLSMWVSSKGRKLLVVSQVGGQAVRLVVGVGFVAAVVAGGV